MSTPTAAEVLFLHPVALDKRAADWLEIPRLRAITLPGHGDHARDSPRLSLDDMVEQIAEGLSEPVHLVGCSLGGMLAMRLALRYPDRVASLVLAFTTASVPRDAMLDRARQTENEDVVVLAEATMGRWFSAEVLSRTPLPPPVAYAAAKLVSMERFAIAQVWRAIAEHDVHDELVSIAVPATCVAGLADASTPLSAVEAIASRIPRSTLVTMEGPHMGFLETPAEFSAIVREHIERVGSLL